MRNALIIAIENPNQLLPRSFSNDYGFPRTALVIASCVKLWGAKLGIFPRILNIDAKIQKKLDADSTENDIKELHKNIIEQEMHAYAPELVLIVAAYSNLSNWASHAARVCKKTNQDIVVVTGGPHATFTHSMLLKLPDRVFDAIILGPGESKLKHILENFDDQELRFTHPGISTLDNLQDFTSDAQSNNAPIPKLDYTLIDSEDIGSGGTVVMAGRGCPHACKFCIESMYWRNARVEPNAEVVRNELVDLSRLGVPVFGCGDSLFDMRTDHNPSFECFCEEAFGGLNLHEHFFILARLHMLHPSGSRAFQKAGGRAVWVGLESASADLLKTMGKSERDLKEQLSFPKKEGLRVGAFFMLGFPGETIESAKKTLRLMEDLFTVGLIDYVDTSLFVPYPGLPMYDLPENYGIKPKKPEWDNWDNWGRYNTPPVYDLPGMSGDDLYKYWKEALNIKHQYDIREKDRT